MSQSDSGWKWKQSLKSNRIANGCTEACLCPVNQQPAKRTQNELNYNSNNPFYKSHLHSCIPKTSYLGDTKVPDL